MALIKQKLAIAFSEGLNSKVDPKQRQIGILESVENAIYNEIGALNKRNGYDNLTLDSFDGTISNVKRIANFERELCAITNTEMYSYSEGASKWALKGNVANVFPTSFSVLRNNYEQSNIASAHVNGIDVIAWEDARNGIRISAIDSETGNTILADYEITSTGTNPRVEFIGNEAFIFYIDSADVKYRKINPLVPDSIGSEVKAVDADLNGTEKMFDTVSVQDKIILVWYDSSDDTSMRSIEADETLGTVQTESSEAPTDALSVTTDDNARIIISYYNGTAVKLFIRNLTLTSNIVAPTVIETVSNVVNCGAVKTSENVYTCYYEISGASSSVHFIKQNTIDLAATVGTASVFIRSCGLVAEPFTYLGVVYVPVIHESTLQSTIFILNSSASVVSKIASGLCGTLLDSGMLPQVSQISDQKFLLAHQIKGRNVSEGNSFFSILGVQRTELDFDKNEKFENARLGQNLHISGGVLQCYDSQQIVEHGFNIFPETLTAGTNAASGGSMSDGTFQYSAVYSWTDNKGQEHRSAPSIPLSVTTTAGGTSQTQQVVVPTLRLTEKTNVIIELYRTEAAGTIFYKVTSTTSPTYNNPAADTVTITDTLSDASLISRETLYTTGGVLDNIAAPSASLIESLNNRIFLSGLEDFNKIQYSKIRSEGSPVTFNDTLTINVNPTGGAITAIKAMDDKLVIFKQSAIFYLAGDGPNNLGEQDTFTEPELITSDIGCSTPNSVVLTSQGIMFMSEKGIHMLDRGYQVSYIGAPVEKFNHVNIKAATVKPTDNQVIFLSDGEATLVYNYLLNKWSTFTNHQGISATLNINDYFYVRKNGNIFKESTTNKTDAGSHIKMKAETSWISLAGMQQYKRIYRALVLGDFKSPHKLKIQIAYDFKEAYVQDKTIDVSDFTDYTKYGESSPYGAEAVYGGNGNLYQFRIDFKRQKCQSFKIKIEDIQDSNYGEGMSLSNILIVAGAKNTEQKPKQSRIYGTR